MTELPANPSHTGLIAQGWNWSLANIKSYLVKYPNAIVNIGQMYITESGNTEIVVKMPEGRLSPIMSIAVNGTITIDWGDNTTPDTITGTSLLTRLGPSHTYSNAGDYMISIHAETGNLYSFYCTNNYQILRKNSSSNENRIYANCVRNVRLGNGINTIYDYAFYYNYSLSGITIPNGVTSIEPNTFNICYSLVSVIIPDDVTSIESYVFYGCFSLSSITIPNGVTSIKSNAIQSCYSISGITIPDSVTAIGNSAFNNCYGLKEFHLLSTTPPTLDSAITNIPSDLVIYVPQGSLSAYQTATNWSSAASKMQEEPT